MLPIAERYVKIRSIAGAGVMALAVALSACSNGSAPAGDAASSLPSEPVDVVAAASEMLQEGFDADFDLTMEMTLLGQRVSARGDGHMAGQDLEATMSMSVIGEKSEMSMVLVDGVAYQKIGKGPWIKQSNTEFGSDFGLSLATIDSVAPLQAGKQMTWQGQEVQVLTRTISGAKAVKALELEGKLVNATLSQRILVLDDGTPVRLVGDVKTAMAGQKMSMQFVMEFDPVEDADPVVAPADPWKPLVVHNGLEAAMPLTWEHQVDKKCGDCDRFFGGFDGQVLLVSNLSPYSLEDSIHMVMQAVSERGGASAKHRQEVINGVTWQVASMDDKNSDGERASLTAGTAEVGGRSVLVFSWDDPLHPQRGRAMFTQFAAALTLASAP